MSTPAQLIEVEWGINGTDDEESLDSVDNNNADKDGSDNNHEKSPTRRRRSSNGSSSIMTKEPSPQALKALQLAGVAAKNFDTAFEIVNKDREQSVPLFHSAELVLSNKPIRTYGYTSEYALQDIRIIMDLCADGTFGTDAAEARHRLADRVVDGGHGDYYSVKFLQSGLLDSDHGTSAVCDFMVETKLLMNLAPHPHVESVYGVNGAGIDAFCETSKKSGFFIIVDRIQETLDQRLAKWATEKNDKMKNSKSLDAMLLKTVETPYSDRLELAMEIASALVFLHARDLVFYVRPDKVGFDMRYNRAKLINLSQVRQVGMVEHARSITKSDCMQTLAYTAPEVFCKVPATTATDVYAFGMMVWHMLQLELPFAHHNRATHFEEVVKHHERPKIPDEWPKEVRETLQKCWHPFKRPTMKSIHQTLEAYLLFAEDECTLKADYIETNLKRPEMAPERKPVQQQTSAQESVRTSHTETTAAPSDAQSTTASANDGKSYLTTLAARSASVGRSRSTKRPSTSGGEVIRQSSSRGGGGGGDDESRATASRPRRQPSSGDGIKRSSTRGDTDEVSTARSNASRPRRRPSTGEGIKRSSTREDTTDRSNTTDRGNASRPRRRPSTGEGIKKSSSRNVAEEDDEDTRTSASRPSRRPSTGDGIKQSLPLTNEEADTRGNASRPRRRPSTGEGIKTRDTARTPSKVRPSTGEVTTDRAKSRSRSRVVSDDPAKISRARSKSTRRRSNETEGEKSHKSSSRSSAAPESPTKSSEVQRSKSNDDIPARGLQRQPSNGSIIQMAPVHRRSNSNDGDDASSNSNSVEIYSARRGARRDQMARSASTTRLAKPKATNNPAYMNASTSHLSDEKTARSNEAISATMEVTSTHGDTTTTVLHASEHSSIETQLLAAMKGDVGGDETHRRIVVKQKDGSKRIIRVSIRKKSDEAVGEPDATADPAAKPRRSTRRIIAAKSGLEGDLARIASGDDARQRSRSKSRTRRGERSPTSQDITAPLTPATNKTPLRARSRSRGRVAKDTKKSTVTDAAVSPTPVASKSGDSARSSTENNSSAAAPAKQIPSVPIKVTKATKSPTSDGKVLASPKVNSSNEKLRQIYSPGTTMPAATEVPKTPFDSLTTQFLQTFDHRGFDNIPSPPMNGRGVQKTFSESMKAPLASDKPQSPIRNVTTKLSVKEKEAFMSS